MNVRTPRTTAAHSSAGNRFEIRIPALRCGSSVMTSSGKIDIEAAD